MAGAKIISLVDIKLREEMITRDVIIDELAVELATLREMIDALVRDVDRLKQGGGITPSSADKTEENGQ